MSGTRAGGLKARDTNLRIHGDNFYQIIGAMGGRNGTTGGFAANHELASKAGKIGGAKSRRGVSVATAEKLRAEFQEGFEPNYNPSWRDKLKQFNKTRSK